MFLPGAAALFEMGISMIHVVTEGDSVSSIAGNYGVAESRLIYDNELPEDGTLVIGQALLIQVPEVVYRVQPMDTLYGIANTYDTTILQLIRNNPYLMGQEALREGDVLVISYQREQPVKNLVANGYAYPFTRRDLLREGLLYLSELSVFSYGFTMQGTLIPPETSYLLEQAEEFSVVPVLVLTSLNESGTFSNQLVNALVENEELQDTLIGNLLLTCLDKGYEAVDVDFEYILPEDRQNYAAFITRLAERMHTQNIQVYVALPPKISADQKGLLYEGIDYGALGSAADGVLLMTYEWGYKYGPPMAVAPIQSVRRVLDYAITEIPVEKISMGIPNYAYDWQLPYERGVTVAETIGNTQAVSIAREYGVAIAYDEQSQTPFFYYETEGVEHVVWFEDVRSIQAKFNLIKEYGFRGAGYWNLLRSFRANWLLLNENFRII